MRSSILPLALIATIAFAIPIASFAAGSGPPPLLVPYSGTLELNGAPATGTFAMGFRLFDGDENDGAAIQLWSNTRDVEVASGQFSVTLGTDSSIPNPAAEARTLFVEIDVEGTQLGGRQRVAPALQAVRAATATDFDVTGDITAQTIGATVVNATTANVDTVAAVNVNGDLVAGSTLSGTNVSAQNFAQTGGENQFNFTGDHTGSGYIRIGELQIAWGELNKTFSTGDHTVNFPAAFSSPPTVTVSLRDPGFGGSAATSGIGARTVNNGNFVALYKGATGVNVASWTAMGPWR